MHRAQGKEANLNSFLRILNSICNSLKKKGEGKGARKEDRKIGK